MIGKIIGSINILACQMRSKETIKIRKRMSGREEICGP
jgi:hypothetical protein